MTEAEELELLELELEKDRAQSGRNVTGSEKTATDSTDPLSVGNITGSAIEPLMAMATGAPAFIASGLAGLGAPITNKLGITNTDPADVVKQIQEKFTYQPRTSGGQIATEALMWPMEKYIEKVAEPTGESVLRTTGSPAAAAVSKALMESAPMFLGGRSARGMTSEPTKTPLGTAAKVVDAVVGAPYRGGRAVVRGGWHLAEPYLTSERRAAGRTVNELVGPYKEDVILALENAREGQTAGQAAIGSGSHEFSALQRLAEEREPSLYGGIKDAQRQRRSDVLREEFGTPEQLKASQEALASVSAKDYGKVQGDLIDPRSGAQMLQEAARKAQMKALEAEASKAFALKDWGRFKTLEAQLKQLAKGEPPVTGTIRDQSARDGRAQPAEPNMWQSPRFKGEVPAPARYAPQTPRAVEAGKAAEEAARIADVRKTAERTHSEISESMLLNTLGEDMPSLAKFMDRPSIQKAIKRAKKSAQERGIYFPENPGDKFSVANLQRIKRAVAEDINKKRVKGSLSATELAEVTATTDLFTKWLRQKSPGFAAAEDAFAAAKGPINQMEIGQLLRDKLEGVLGSKERALAFANAIEQGNKTVKDATGRDVPMESVLTEKQMGLVNQIKDDLNIDVLLKEQGITGSKALNRKLEGALPPKIEGGILERSFVIAKAIMNRMHGKATEKTLDYITSKMNDPKEMMKIMEEATPTEKAVLETYVKARNQALVSGALAGQESNQ